MDKLTVIDFFCGGGGFSEGFRQAGFNVLWAVDIWQPAVNTHSENHPETETIKDNVIRLSNLPDDEFHKIIPDSDVIIGSPPCTAFSNSNRSGKADKSKGIELFEAYLRIVARKKFKKNSILKYWVLENVPKVKKHLKESYSAKDLGLTGNFELVVKGSSSNIYNAKYFGVPSSRLRFFCGDFPMPQKVFNDKQLIPLKTILKSLGTPKEKLENEIIDPLYDIKIKGSEVTDHHYIQELAEFEWLNAKRLKQDKGYMGKMSLPENVDKPSRTIMATLSFSARESFILGLSNNRYRAPTIREVASLMSFPIDYRFYGGSIGVKYKLVGNSVPPKMSYAIAKAILKEEQKSVKNKYIPIHHANKLEFTNLNFLKFKVNVEKPKRENSKFKYHIPSYIFNAYRVELTNKYSNFKKELYRWNAEIHYSQGERAAFFNPKLDQIQIEKKDITIANQFLKEMPLKPISYSSFQKAFCEPKDVRVKDNFFGPYELLESIRNFIDKNFEFEKEDLKININSKKIKSVPRPTAIGYYILYKSINKMKSI